VETVHHACPQRRLQTAPNQLGDGFANGKIAGSRVGLGVFEYVIIE